MLRLYNYQTSWAHDHTIIRRPERTIIQLSDVLSARSYNFHFESAITQIKTFWACDYTMFIRFLRMITQPSFVFFVRLHDLLSSSACTKEGVGTASRSDTRHLLCSGNGPWTHRHTRLSTTSCGHWTGSTGRTGLVRVTANTRHLSVTWGHA